MMEKVHKAAARNLGALSLVAFPIFLAGCEPSPDDLYPAPWVRERSAAIDRVLSSHNVTGCENIAYRPSDVSSGPLDPRGVFLIYCSSDGANWAAYIATPSLARDRNLTGPFETYAEIPPP
jgi:hypothetical protein